MSQTQNKPSETGSTLKTSAVKWKRRCLIVISAWLLTTVLMSFPTVRGIVIYPLYVSDGDASGEVAYVMADGYAYWERFHAASDLYHWNRVDRIVLLAETELSSYNFVREKSDTRIEKAIDYLGWYGVPKDRITTIPQEPSALLGSLSEAQSFAKHHPDIKNVVVVTSAPHTRRSRLCFRRLFPVDVNVAVYSASSPFDSAERDAPIWVEYVKLMVYCLVA